MTTSHPHQREAGEAPSNNPVAQVLNRLLADHFALYLKTKGFHWHVSGPHFRDYHRMLDEQAEQILAATDPIAERVRKIGASTVMSISDIARRQTIQDTNQANLTAGEMLKMLLRDNRILVLMLREAKAIADRANDNATSGMIDGWTDAAEQRVWFLVETSNQ